MADRGALDRGATVRERVELGEFELFLVSDGTYGQDGGAFFGVVPKSLWSKKRTADDRNLVRGGLNCLVVRTPRGTVLVETGIGDKLDEKAQRIWDIRRERSLPEDIACHGIDPNSIHLVINTHLHFDHCGGNTRWENGAPGKAVPVFPHAKYVVQRGEWEHAHLRLDRDRVSYIDENYDPLIESGRMTLLDGDTELEPGIRVEVVPGHTRNMMVVFIESGGHTCAYFADLVPSAAHLTPTWVMAYDLFPLETIENKKRLLPQAAAQHWLCVFVHDADTPWGYVKCSASGRFELQEP